MVRQSSSGERVKEAQGAGALGTGALGAGALGTGAQGAGAQGTGAQGTGAQGTGAQGTGALIIIDKLLFDGDSSSKKLKRNTDVWYL